MHNESWTCNLTPHIALLEEEEMPFELELNGVIHYKLFTTDLSESYIISTCIFNCFGNSGSVPKKKKYKQWLHSSSCYPQPTKTPVCTLLVVFCILKCRILKERISEIENNINTKSNLNFSIASSNSKMCPTLSPPYWTDTVVHSQVTQLSYLHVAYAKMYQTMPRRQNLKKHQEFLRYKQES